MQAIVVRNIPFIDSESLTSRDAREALFRDEFGFLLYLSDATNSNPTQERLIRLDAREALLWVNEGPQDYGSFWN